MANQQIDVNFNAQGQAEVTAVQDTPTPLTEAQRKAAQKKAEKNKAIAIGIAINTGRQVFNAVTSNVTNVTGRSDIQRKVNQGLNNGRIISQIGFGFAAGGMLGVGAIAAVGVEAAINVLEQNLEIRNKNIEADYYRQMRGNRIDRSRS